MSCLGAGSRSWCGRKCMQWSQHTPPSRVSQHRGIRKGHRTDSQSLGDLERTEDHLNVDPNKERGVPPFLRLKRLTQYRCHMVKIPELRTAVWCLGDRILQKTTYWTDQVQGRAIAALAHLDPLLLKPLDFMIMKPILEYHLTTVYFAKFVCILKKF